MAGTLLLILCYMLCLHFVAESTTSNENRHLVTKLCAKFLNNSEKLLPFPQFCPVGNMRDNFARSASLILTLLLVAVLSSVPIYFMRWIDTDHIYSSHWNTYAWKLSFSYLEGKVMGILLLCVWCLAALGFYLHIFIAVIETKDESRKIEKSTMSSPVEEGRGRWKFRAMIAFIGNLSATLSVNAFYILSITEQSLSPTASFFVRFGVSLFRIISSAVIVPFLANQIKGVGEKSLFMFKLHVFNNLFIPCVVTALTSSNCFQVW